MSHQTNSRKPTAAAQPVMRCRIDSDMVYANLYTPRWGESGRWSIFRPQKSTQRPFFSQSPKRVGSGPGGPPISSDAAGADCTTFAVRAAAESRSGALGGTTSEGAFGT